MDVHVIGFAKVVGDITEGALAVAIRGCHGPADLFAGVDLPSPGIALVP
jgi:hypothetical protein